MYIYSILLNIYIYSECIYIMICMSYIYTIYIYSIYFIYVYITRYCTSKMVPHTWLAKMVTHHSNFTMGLWYINIYIVYGGCKLTDIWMCLRIGYTPKNATRNGSSISIFKSPDTLWSSQKVHGTSSVRNVKTSSPVLQGRWYILGHNKSQSPNPMLSS